MVDFDYLSPEEMYAIADPKPPQGSVYYEEKIIPDTMAASDLQAEISKGRFWIIEGSGSVIKVGYTQFFYTEVGRNLKRSKITGSLVMATSKPIEKWVVIS